MCVFWQRGYEATSLEDLLSAMDLSKSSFYQAFGGKGALFKRCLESYRDAAAETLRGKLEKAPTGRQFIETTLQGVADGTQGRMGRAGCLLMNTATEFAQRDPEIAALVARSLQRFEDLFFDAVQRAQREGEIPAGADARGLAQFLATNLGGLKAMARAGADPVKIRSVVSIVMNALR